MKACGCVASEERKAALSVCLLHWQFCKSWVFFVHMLGFLQQRFLASTDLHMPLRRPWIDVIIAEVFL